MPMRIAVSFICLALVTVGWICLLINVQARDLTNLAQTLTPEQGEWFRKQEMPTTGGLCCSEADGVFAEEDIRNGHYWTRWRLNVQDPVTQKWMRDGPVTDWMIVPDGAVLRNGNPNGSPVVWYGFQQGSPFIRCFAPGGGV